MEHRNFAEDRAVDATHEGPNDANGTADCAGSTQEPLLWLPSVSSQGVVLPTERADFLVAKSSACAAVRLAWSRGLPLASSQTGQEPLGTALHIEAVTEKEGGSQLEVAVLGLAPLRIVDRGTQPYRHSDGKPNLANVVGVVLLGDQRSSARLGEALQSQVRLQFEALRGADALAEAPGDLSEFSWFVAARLPLPAPFREHLLRIRSPEERLSVCNAVLRPLTAGGRGLRSKL